MNLPPNLCYTVALDHPGQEAHRLMARLLVTSLLRTNWHGRIAVFRNTPKPVLPKRHPQVAEILIQTGKGSGWKEMIQWKSRVRDLLDLAGVGKVLFLDCDCVALRDINHLMRGTWDIYTTPEPGSIVEFPFNGLLTAHEMIALKNAPGINSGTIGISATRFVEVMAEWERINMRPKLRPSKSGDQHGWNRLMLDTQLRHRHFAPAEIQFPFLHRAVYTDYRRAAIVHAAGRSTEQKLSLLYGLWMETFGFDCFDKLVVPYRAGGRA